MTYVFNNGVEFLRYCDYTKWTLGDFFNILDALGLPNFKSFDLLVFTYDVCRSFIVSFIDGRNVEIVFDNVVLAASKFKFLFLFFNLVCFEILYHQLWIVCM